MSHALSLGVIPESPDVVLTGLLLILGGMVGAAALAVLFLRPKVFACLTVLSVLSARSLETITGQAFFGSLDEALVLGCLVGFSLLRVLSGRALRCFPGLGAFFIFAVLGFVSALVLAVPIGLAGNGLFLALKGVIFGLAVCQLDWQTSDIVRLAKGGAAYGVFMLVCVLANALLPSIWAARLASTGVVNRRASGVSLIGPFVHPGELGLIASLIALAALAWLLTHTATGRTRWLFILTVLSAVASLRRKSLVGLLVGSWFLAAKQNFGRTIVITAVLAPLLVAVAGAPLLEVARFTVREYATNPDETARIVLTRDAVDVAADHFPLGAGFSRFGSFLAARNYSPEYAERGYPSIYGLGNSPEAGRFLSDTQWPAVFGEAGVIGGTAFAYGLVLMYRRCKRLGDLADEPHSRWLALVGMAWSLQYAVESIASPVYSSPPAFGILFAVVGVVHAVTVTREQSVEGGVLATADRPTHGAYKS